MITAAVIDYTCIIYKNLCPPPLALVSGPDHLESFLSVEVQEVSLGLGTRPHLCGLLKVSKRLHDSIFVPSQLSRLPSNLCCSSQRGRTLLLYPHSQEILVLSTPLLVKSEAFPTATWSASCFVPLHTPQPPCNGPHPTLNFNSDR